MKVSALPNSLVDTRRLRHFATHWYEVAKALVDSLADTLTETEVKRLGQPLSGLEGEALVDRLVDTLKGAKAKTFGHPLNELAAEALVDRLVDKLRDA